MAMHANLIRPLDASVRSQIRSHVEITSLLDAVEQLFRNALDSGAENVRIAVDFKKGYCSCIDNGLGIHAQEFGPGSRLAQPYCTSRSDPAHYYGRNGQALASLAASSLLAITSRQRGQQAYTVVHHQGSRVSCGESTPDAMEDLGAHGTKVVLHNLFGNLPVRFKAQALKSSDPVEVERQFSALRRHMVAYLLAASRPIGIYLHVIGTALSYRSKTVTDLPSFSVPRIHGVLKQFTSSLACEASTWKLSSAKAGGISIRLATCTKPAPSKTCQFISFGQWPVHNHGVATVFYDVINDAFDASNFGTHFESAGKPGHPRYIGRQSLIKSIDRWPCFYVRVDCSTSEMSNLGSRNEAQDLVSTGLQPVIELLVLLVNHFLEKQSLQPRHQTSFKHGKRSITAQRSTHDCKTYFDDWSRTKSAFVHEFGDLREGLPFIDQEPFSHGDFDADVQLLLDDIERDTEPFTSDNTSSVSKVTADQPPNTDYVKDAETSFWVNPRTGNKICLNDSSFVIPATTDCGKCCTADTVSNPQLAQKPARRPREQQEPGALVQRLKQWPLQTFNAATETPINTLGSSTDGVSDQRNLLTLTVDESLSASDLASARILRQVDEKFILIAVERDNEGGQLLALVDQHAADERLKVEEFIREICTGTSKCLSRPIIIESDEEELRLFDGAQDYFAHWGLVYHRSEMSQHAICVTHLPMLVAERCRQEPRVLIDLLRKEIWTNVGGSFMLPSKHTSWINQVVHCPRGLIEMVNSRACRSAIMFNDVLTMERCQELVHQLSRCTLPFQCAHGRPSLSVLAKLGYPSVDSFLDKAEPSFAKAYGNWISDVVI